MLICFISTAQHETVTHTLQHLQSTAHPDPGSCDRGASWWPPADGEEGTAHACLGLKHERVPSPKSLSTPLSFS